MESGRPWIPPYQVRSRLSQARNDKNYKIWLFMHNNGGIHLILPHDGDRYEKADVRWEKIQCWDLLKN
jgi:hypothetical protein